jgi:hypothetical protein
MDVEAEIFVQANQSGEVRRCTLADLAEPPTETK